MESTITTWTRLFGYSWEDAYNADPNGELDLTDEQRTEFNRECESHLEAEAEAILNKIDDSAYVLGGMFSFSSSTMSTRSTPRRLISALALSSRIPS